MKLKPHRFLLLIFALIHCHVYAQWLPGTIGTNDLNCVRYLDANTVFVGGATGLFKSTDGGANFSPAAFSALTSVNDLWIINSSTMVAVGSIIGNSEMILKTENGGASWAIVNVNNAGNWPRELTSVHFPTASIGYTTGTNGRILKTVDGGNSWITLSIPTIEELQSVFFVNSFIGFVVSETSIWKTTNGGGSWTSTSFNKSLRGITFTSADVGFVVGDNMILKTTNQGVSWVSKPFSESAFFTDIKMVNSDSGYVLASNGIYKTANKGESFHRQTSFPNGIDGGIDFGSLTTGVACSYYGNIFKTTTGGGNVPRDDSKIAVVDLPSANNCKGVYPVSVRISNHGINPLNTVRIKWKVNNIVQPSVNWSGNLSFNDTSASIFLGNYDFALATNNITIWTEAPNGVADNNVSNDTINANYAPKRLGGTYTIGGASPNYTSLSAAFSALYAGLCGDVTFKIRNGTHTITAWTWEIADSLLKEHKIIFESESGDSSKVTIEGSWDSYGFLRFRGLRNVTFSKLTFKNTTGPTILTCINGAKNIRFQNCVLRAPLNSTSEIRGLIECNDQSGFDSIIVLNSRLVGGQTGVMLKTAPLPSVQNYPAIKGCFIQVENCELDSQWDRGVYLSGSCSGVIKNNRILGGSFRISSSIGIAVYNNHLPLHITNNDILQEFGTGIKFWGCFTIQNYPMIVTNNFIKIKDSRKGVATTEGIGIDGFDVKSVIIAHNTVIVDGTSTGTALYCGGINGTVVNNIFSVNGPGNYVFGTGSGTVVEGNAIYASSGRISRDLYSLSQWQSVTESGYRMVVADAEWTTDDFHLPLNRNNYAILDKGIPFPMVSVDKEGQQRSATHPDPGADELDILYKDVALSCDTGIVKKCSGLSSVDINITNYGKDTIRSLMIAWKVNGIVQTPYAWSGLLAPGTSISHLSLASITRVTGNRDTISAYISSSNGLAESITINDSCFFIRKTGGLSGTYTIGGTNPDYPGFNAAKNDLLSKGICGPVVFNVRPGIYNEQMRFTAIEGSGNGNTITFQSEQGDSSTTLLSFATTALNNYVLAFDSSSSYISFKKIGIQNTSTTNIDYNVILLLNSSHHITLSNLLVIGIVESQVHESSLIKQDKSAIDNVSILQSHLIGSNFGIMLSEYSYPSIENLPYGNEYVIRGNQFDDQYYYAIYMKYHQQTEIAYNKFVSATGSNVLIRNHQGELSIHHNKYGGAQKYGLKLQVNNSYSSELAPARIYNNFINYLSLGGVSSVNVLHNTILSPAWNSSSLVCSGTKIKIINNIIQGTDSLEPPIYMYSPIQSVVLSNNCLFTNCDRIARFDFKSYYSLYDWQKDGFDQNSINKNPELISMLNPHVSMINSGVLESVGANMGIADDIDGEPRNMNNPDIGADEFMFQPVPVDAAMIAIQTPALLCSDSVAITVKIRNLGADTLKSVMINWKVNGVVQPSVSLNVNLSYLDTSGLINLGLFRFDKRGLYTITANTSNPNGIADLKTSNDSLQIGVVRTRMFGTYTIGIANSDYPRLSEALDDLKNLGVCGPVTFLLRDGTYEESITIPEIDGASAINTITFQGENNDSSLVVILSPQVSKLFSVGLKGADHIIFRSITFNSGFGTSVYLFGRADHNTFERCHFYGSFVADTICSYLELNNSFFAGSLILKGSSGIDTGYFAKGIIIQQNIFQGNASNPYVNAIISIVYYDSAVLIKGNALFRNSDKEAIQLLNCKGQFEISKNNIQGSFQAGINVSSVFYNELYPHSLISNNFIAGSWRGIKIGNQVPTDIAHNSIRAGAACIFFYETSPLNIYNNILVSDDSTGSCLWVMITDPTNILVNSDYNLFFSKSTHLLTVPHNYPVPYSYYNSLSSMYSYIRTDQHSIEGDPVFVSKTNLHVLGTLVRGKGVQVNNVTDDIDGDPRNYTPDIGADEGLLIPYVNLGNDTTLCSFEPYLLFNKFRNREMQYQWSNGDTADFITITQPGKYWLKVSNTNGVMIDTIEIGMVNPPVLTIGPDTTVCGTIELKSNIAGIRYLWSTGDSATTTFARSTGFYHLTLTDHNFCKVKDTVQVTVLETPDIKLGKDTLVCGNLSLHLNLPSGYKEYRWSNGDTVNFINITQPGTYHVWVSSDNHCVSFDTIKITNGSFPVVNLGNDTGACVGKTILLDAGNPGSIYKWSTGATGKTITPTTVGTYSVMVTNIAGCSGVDSINYKELPKPKADFYFTWASYPSYRFIVIKDNATEYKWDFGDGSTSTLKLPEHAYATSGTYRVHLDATNECGVDSFGLDLVYNQRTGIEESAFSENDVKVFPNPSNTRLTVVLKDKGESDYIELFGIEGKKIQLTDFYPDYSGWGINTSNLAEGCYLLVVHANENKHVIKFNIIH